MVGLHYSYANWLYILKYYCTTNPIGSKLGVRLWLTVNNNIEVNSIIKSKLPI